METVGFERPCVPTRARKGARPNLDRRYPVSPAATCLSLDENINGVVHALRQRKNIGLTTAEGGQS
jgi:hypothetical protein